jgi:hypothetical protein
MILNYWKRLDFNSVLGRWYNILFLIVMNQLKTFMFINLLKSLNHCLLN